METKPTKSEKKVNKKVNEDKKSSEGSAKSITQGSIVSITYVGTFDDGQIFDQMDETEPLKFTVGENKLLPDFENAVVGMKLNEEKAIKLTAEHAYGNVNENLVQQVPRQIFEGKIDIKPNIRIMFKTPEGNNVYARVLEIGEDAVRLDFNHPLAGKNLNFKIKVIAIE